MKYWLVVTKFFGSGRVKVNIAPVKAESKPADGMQENAVCDEYHDYFETYEEAAAWAQQAREA
nr:MAG: hypothetical protein [Bacteriophage sp.]